MDENVLKSKMKKITQANAHNAPAFAIPIMRINFNNKNGLKSK